MHDPTGNLAEALVRAGGYAKAPDSLAKTPFTIALSREAGALGNAVAREVGRRLGWPVYDNEILKQLADDMKVGVHLVEDADERPGSWLRETVQMLLSGPSVNEAKYFRRLLKILVALGSKGECLIVGRGAAQFLPPASTLRVRLLADREDRIANMRRERGFSAEEAARFVDDTDKLRKRFIQEHFHKDPADPQHYDLVLNTSRFSTMDCADLVIEALRRLQAEKTETRR